MSYEHVLQLMITVYASSGLVIIIRELEMHDGRIIGKLKGISSSMWIKLRLIGRSIEVKIMWGVIFVGSKSFKWIMLDTSF